MCESREWPFSFAVASPRGICTRDSLTAAEPRIYCVLETDLTPRKKPPPLVIALRRYGKKFLLPRRRRSCRTDALCVRSFRPATRCGPHIRPSSRWRFYRVVLQYTNNTQAHTHIQTKQPRAYNTSIVVRACAWPCDTDGPVEIRGGASRYNNPACAFHRVFISSVFTANLSPVPPHPANVNTFCRNFWPRGQRGQKKKRHVKSCPTLHHSAMWY